MTSRLSLPRHLVASQSAMVDKYRQVCLFRAQNEVGGAQYKAIHTACLLRMLRGKHTCRSEGGAVLTLSSISQEEPCKEYHPW